MASGANFDAEIRLDIEPFIASIKRAQNEVAKLSKQIDTINNKKLTVQSGVSAGAVSGTGVGAGSRDRMSAARQQIGLENELSDARRESSIAAGADFREQQKNYDTLSKRMDDRINAESRMRSIESARIKSSMEERNVGMKNHATFSSQMDDRIAQEAKQRRDSSNAIKGQMRDNAASAQQMERNLSRERYALYDVAATYTIVATAAAAAVAATAGTAIAYERAFADVQRTTDFTSAKIGAAAESAKVDLKSLASEIPVAFGQITQIATIGNQLGIAQGAITSFTETVAKFSATTGVSVDSTAMAFGRIGELLGVPAQEFEKLGSSIAFAGVNAVATEEQILSVTKEIATTAKMAKFSSADIVGLSTALSSLGIAPEAARGSIIRTFAGINAAISKGGEALEGYASVAGMSAEQFAATWQENGEAGLSALLKGLQGLSNEGANLDTVLRELGMKNVRDIQTVQKLGDNYAVYTNSLKDANQGFKEGTFLGEAYGVIQETVASKLALVSNSFANLLDSLGQGAVGETFKGLLDGVNELLIRMNQLARTPLGQSLGAIAVVASVVVAAIAAVNAVSALTAASLKAFAVAQGALTASATTATGAMGRFSKGMLAVAAASNTTAGSLNKTQLAVNAISTVLRAVKWIAIFTAITVAVERIGLAFTSVEQKAESLLGGFSGLQDALNADTSGFVTALSELGGDVQAARDASGVIANLSTELENNNEETNKAIASQNALNNVVGLGANNVSLLSTAVETQNFVIGANTTAWVRNAIAQSEAFQKLSQNADALNAISEAGFDLDAALQATANGTFDQYMDNIQSTAVSTVGGFEQFIFTMDNAGAAVGQATEGLGFFGDMLEVLASNLAYPISLVGRLINEFTMLFGINLFPVSAGVDALRDSVQGAYTQMLLFGGAGKVLNETLAETNARLYAEHLDKFGESAKGAAKALRTVVDYANDLRTVFSRAFEIRFGRRDALDQIASGWNNIAEKADSARQAIRNANAEIAELAADRSILAYQLTVAERYGDEQRAAVIRAKIAKIDNNVADKKQDIADATAELTKSTDGNTNSAIENRNILREQVQSYASYIEMLSKTGLKGKELRDRVKELKEEFKKNATEAGFSNEALKPYLKTFDDMRETINKTPRNVDIEFKANVSPAQQALTEFLAKLKNTTGTLKIDADLNKTRLVQAAQDQITYLQQDRAILARFGRPTGQIDSQITAARTHLAKVLALSGGGLVSGSGGPTSDSIPAMLSNGEFVVKASAVGAYGVDFLNAINQQRVGSFTSGSMSVGGGSGTTVAYLSPDDRALLRAVIDRPVNLYTENAKIASSANAGNVVLAQRGTN